MKVNQSAGQASGLSNSGSASGAEAAKKTAKPDAAKTKSVDSDNGGAGKTSASDGATAEISFRAKEMAQAKQLAANAPDVRQEKVAELKRRIQSGEYSVSANKVADKMVDEHVKTAALN